ncbi:hypothetical protein PoB_007026100 [Plakobranchus ocellatus]|uniref:Uncharacterized protein n=1 Tax=Plakobranchus ocellatus TaxID=259542 RepID=A0AAV4DIS0_9GAST|nr:hypothetical protein PoB_007026100 [Plakobranchus ocellatus]
MVISGFQALRQARALGAGLEPATGSCRFRADSLSTVPPTPLLLRESLEADPQKLTIRWTSEWTKRLTLDPVVGSLSVCPVRVFPTQHGQASAQR